MSRQWALNNTYFLESTADQFVVNDQYFNAAEAGTTAVLTGTSITGSPTEADVVAGTAGTIIITIAGDTFKAAGTGVIGSTADTTALFNGISGSASWNAEVRANFAPGDIVRDGDNQCTITIGAEAGYDISSTDTITVTVPTDVQVIGAGAIVATPTISITAVAAGSLLLQNRSIANFHGMRK